MSYRKYDMWTKELADGRVVEYLYGTLFQSEGKTKSWAGAKLSGVASETIHNLPADMTRAQVEALFEKSITTP
jgi:hypothetical protein